MYGLFWIRARLYNGAIMISFLDGKYIVENDKWNWILKEQVLSKNRKTGEAYFGTKETYHPNFAQVCQYIINKESKECRSIEQLKELYFDSICMLDGYKKEIDDEM